MMPGIVVERAVEQVAGLSLVERRRAGEVFARVPVGSLELTREQVVAGLYLSRAALPCLPARPSQAQMLAVLERTAGHLGVEGLNAAFAEVNALGLWDRDANTAFARAYVVCRYHWYRGARSELLPTGAVALALYASDIAVTRGGRSAHGRDVEINGHLMEGVSRVGAAVLARLADQARAEFRADAPAPFAELDAEYRALAPDRRRRAFCYALAVSHQVNPRPLLVRLDAGGCAVGGVMPDCPREVAVRAGIRGGAA
jgi:hypothetical protein